MDSILVSPTPRAFSFPSSVLDISPAFDGPTPRAFSFPQSIHNATAPPLSSTPSTSDNDSPLSTAASASNSPSPSPAPSFHSRSHSHSLSMTGEIRLSSFSLDNTPGSSSTLAHRRRGSSISSLTLASGPNGGALTLAPERRPKRGDEDYIKRPENAFILFRRDCCLRKNAAEAAALNDSATEAGEARKQRQADLSKTISQQWRSLSSDQRKYWDDLAKQRKKEHEEMYPYYVYQPTRSKDKKSSSSGDLSDTPKKHRRDRDNKSSKRHSDSRSRVRGGRNLSTCSTLSTISTASTASSSYGSAVDSEDFSSASASASASASDFEDVSNTLANVGFEEAYAMGKRRFSITSLNSMANGLLPSETVSAFSFDNVSGTNTFSVVGYDGMDVDLSGDVDMDCNTPAQPPHQPFGSILRPSGAPHAHHGHSHSAQATLQQANGPSGQFMGPPLSYVLPASKRSTSAPGNHVPPPPPPFLSSTSGSGEAGIKIPTLLPGVNLSAQEADQSQIPDESEKEGEKDDVESSERKEYRFVGAGAEGEDNVQFRMYNAPSFNRPNTRAALTALTIPPSRGHTRTRSSPSSIQIPPGVISTLASPTSAVSRTHPHPHPLPGSEAPSPLSAVSSVSIISTASSASGTSSSSSYRSHTRAHSHSHQQRAYPPLCDVPESPKVLGDLHVQQIQQIHDLQHTPQHHPGLVNNGNGTLDGMHLGLGMDMEMNMGLGMGLNSGMGGPGVGMMSGLDLGGENEGSGAVGWDFELPTWALPTMYSSVGMEDELDEHSNGQKEGRQEHPTREPTFSQFTLEMDRHINVHAHSHHPFDLDVDVDNADAHDLEHFSLDSAFLHVPKDVTDIDGNGTVNGEELDRRSSVSGDASGKKNDSSSTSDDDNGANASNGGGPSDPFFGLEFRFDDILDPSQF